MAFHHVALATRDAAATHRFYTEEMGFELVKVVAGPTPNEGPGFSKHFFYSTEPASSDPAASSRDLIAFWEIDDPEIGTDFEVDLNKAAGLPGWVNHIAFDAPTRAALDAHRTRWQQHGHTVIEVDHGFCVSIYLTDPSGNMVEFCQTTGEFTDEDRRQATERLLDPQPSFDDDAKIIVHRPTIDA